MKNKIRMNKIGRVSIKLKAKFFKSNKVNINHKDTKYGKIKTRRT